VIQEGPPVPTIRIDHDVYEWLQAQAVPFDDTPNSVLRRLAGLDGARKPMKRGKTTMLSNSEAQRVAPTRPGSAPLARAGELLTRWKVPAVQGRFHRDGMFYERLTRFPGALLDRNGYVVFATEREYRNCAKLKHGRKLNVPSGIWSIEGYVRTNHPI
jgi:hypothetical protein